MFILGLAMVFAHHFLDVKDPSLDLFLEIWGWLGIALGLTYLAGRKLD